MRQSYLCVLAATLAAAFTAFVPQTASAQIASCAALLTDPASPLVGNPAVFSATSVQATTGGRAYCNVTVVWRDPTLVGEGNGEFPGYAPGSGPGTPGSYQHVRMGFGLPLNTNTGTAAWSGRFVQTAGGLDQGSVAGFTGYVSMTNPTTGVGGVAGQAAVGLSTDSGHGTADSGSGDAYGYVQNTRPNFGKLKDWAGGRSYCTSIKLAKQLARAYYGAATYDGTQKRTYWEGFSGGGHMGMTQVQNCPEEYDGVYAGSPSYHWQQFRLQDSWVAMVNKKAVQLGQTFTSGQLNAATSAAIAYCMTRGPGGFAGTTNILHDPRSCDWKADFNICEATNPPGVAAPPAAPNCLTPEKANLVNSMLTGPTNDFGKLVYFPYAIGVGLSTATTVFALSTPQVMRWNHFNSAQNANATLFADQQSVALANNPPDAISFVDEMHLGTTRMSDYADTNNFRIDAAWARGMKIMQTHGTHDNLILFRQDPAFYRRTAVHFYGSADYARLQSWYRFYLVPGLGHSPLPVLPNLINWVENGVAPDRLTGAGRLVCPYPTYAQHLGGATNDVNNFACGGNLEDSKVALCSMLKTPYKGEKDPLVDAEQMGIDPRDCDGIAPGVNKPVASCQAITAAAGPSCSAAANVNNGSSDPDGDPITLAQAPSGPFGLGVTQVTLTATDSTKLVGSCTVPVTVVDTTPPQVQALSASPNVLWPPDRKMVPVSVGVSVTDACDAGIANRCSIVSVTSNEAVNAAGSGNTDPDYQMAGPHKVNLRAERSGKGNGRVYTIAVRCTDASGNSAPLQQVTVSVPHDQGN